MNRIFGIILVGCLLAIPSLGQKYKKKQMLKDLNTLEGFENAFIGFVLYDTEKGKIVAEQNADKQMTPASVTKLYTAYAALDYLPEDLVATEYTIKGDSLIFWSTGYPLSLHPDHRDSTLTHFLYSSDKKLYYWPRPSEDERFGPGWGWDDYSGYYGAEKSRFPIYGNSIEFIVDNQNQTYKYNPSYQGIRISIDTTESKRARVSRDESWNEFKIQFGEEGIDTLIRPFKYSDRLFVELLQNEINKEIEIVDDFERPETNENLLGVKRDSLVKWMLQPSDNLFAEQFHVMIASEKSDTLGVNRNLDYLLEENVFLKNLDLTEELTWRDGSGLTRYNMFTPSSLFVLLSQFKEKYGLDFMKEVLPQGQTSGTISELYSPSVFAKTGTLSNNHSLAGYIETDKGNTMIFVIMANHYTVSTSHIRKQFGVILDKIQKAY